MKIEQVIRQLQAVLPKFSTAFSETVSISTLTRAGALVTATSASAHGLATGDCIYISGAYTPTPIASITRSGTVATATTSTPHDLTMGYHTTVTVVGANQAEYNGTKVLLSAPTRNIFTYRISGSPVTPATGTMYLRELRYDDYNGRKIVTVLNSTQFTYAIATTPGTPAQGTIVGAKGLRISGAINLERLYEIYTKQGPEKLWAFVVAGDCVAGKDRFNMGDASTRSSAGTVYKQEIIQPFTVYVFMPCKSSVSARPQRDTMDDIRKALFKSLLGAKFDSGFSEGAIYRLTFVGDKMTVYNGAYYVHEFNFETVFNIGESDRLNVDDSVAWRDFEIEHLRAYDDYVSRSLVGKLDS